MRDCSLATRAMARGWVPPSHKADGERAEDARPKTKEQRQKAAPLLQCSGRHKTQDTRTRCRPRFFAASRSRLSMLTRRANRVHGLRKAALSLPLLGPLPGDLVKLLLRLLPLDTRLRAREVRRGWCALLEDAELWTHVDLSASCGVNLRFLDPHRGDWRLLLALLRAACVRAKGGLLSVDLSGVFVGWQGVPFVLQLAETLSAAEKASLRDLVAPTSRSLNAGQVTALCLALSLCRVRCTVYCNAVECCLCCAASPPSLCSPLATCLCS